MNLCGFQNLPNAVVSLEHCIQNERYFYLVIRGSFCFVDHNLPMVALGLLNSVAEKNYQNQLF
jgi:hypothetical protein